MTMHIDPYLEGGIDQFEIDVKRRYADQANANRVWKTAERVAQELHEDVQSLAADKEDPKWLEIRELFADPSIDLAEDVELALKARLAWHLRPSFDQAAARCWELAGLLRRARPADAVQQFLHRVVRCYLLDFTPECLVMCRGALENAINARYDVAGVPFPKNESQVATMKLRLEGAEARGWIEAGTAKQLYGEVWIRGSKAAHAGTAGVGNAIGAIKLTVVALATLNPPPSPE